MDVLVLNYLKSRGYSEAAAELQKEMNMTSDTTVNSAVTVARLGMVDPDEDSEEELRHNNRVAARKLMQSKTIASLMAQNTLSSEDLVMFSFIGDGDHAELYNENYDRYRSWALDSLDIIKVELISLCFPLFVTSYFSLIRRGSIETARRFWEQWQSDFTDLYAAEMVKLSIITTQIQLDEGAGGEYKLQSHFVQCCVKNKFKCVISNLAFGLLTAFLAQQELLLAASIINDRVQFVRMDYVPRLSDAGTGLLLELIGYTQVSPVTRAQLPSILVGVPGKKSRPGSVPNYLHDDLYKEWLKKIVLRNMFAAAAKEQQVNRGTMSGHGQGSSIFWRAAEDGGPIGDALEPSVLFATLTNAHEGMICMDLSSNAELAVAGFRDSCVRVWNLTGKPFQGLAETSTDNSGASIFETLPSTNSAKAPLHQSSLASTETGGNLREVDISNSRRSNLPILELRGHSAPVYAVSQEQTHSKGRLLLSSSSDHSIRLWDTQLRQTVGKYNCASTVWGVAFSPIGYYFAAAAADRTVSIYATDRPSQVRFMPGHMSDATCVAWHPNASCIMSGSDDKTVHLWDVRSGQCNRILRGCPSAVSCCSVSPQGDRVAAGTDTGSVHVWDLASGLQIGMLQGHRGPVHSVAFSDAGEALCSGGADYTVRTWDMNQLQVPQSGPNEPMPMHSAVPIFKPAQSYHTKFTPVFFVTYTPRNLLLACGPYALSSAGLSRSAVLHDQRSEEEVIAALGLSYALKQ